MLTVANFYILNLNLNLRVFKTKNESIYLHATDFARKRNYTNPQKAIRDHVSAENKVRFADIYVGAQNVHPLRNQQPHEIMLTEAGGYKLLFGSKLPIAREFKKWMFETVIPSIRQTGEYHLPGALPKFRAITDYDFELIMDNDQQVKEMRKEMDVKRDLIKDQRMSARGKIGGSVTQQKRRDIERKIEEQKEDIESLKDEIETLEEENDRLFEENETMSEEMARISFNESRLTDKIRRLENKLDGVRNLAYDHAQLLDEQNRITKEDFGVHEVDEKPPNEEESFGFPV